jgi:hypothetical protein
VSEPEGDAPGEQIHDQREHARGESASSPLVSALDFVPTVSSSLATAKDDDMFEDISSEIDDTVEVVNVRRAPMEIHLTITPPHTPSTGRVVPGQANQFAPNLLTKLGGYGWRG